MSYSIVKKVQEAGLVLGALGVTGFMGIVWLMIYGNLSGNLGFAAGSNGYNDTQAVVNNMTSGFKTFFGFSNTLFTIAAIVLLIFMLLGLIAVVYSIYDMYKHKGSSGFGSE